jgi:TetR/AcrR family transcriptional regulator, transcriptional repressor for nem operon
MATQPATKRGQATRDRVVTAAMALVRQRGVAATSLDAVEAAAGVGRSQLYHYFDDRDDLLRAVAAKTADTILGRTGTLLAELGSLDGIDRWFAAAVAVNTEHDGVGGCPLGSLVSQLAEHDEQTRAIFVDAFARWEAPLIAGLAQMQQRGELRADASPACLADIIMAAMQGGLLLAQVRRDPSQLQRALAGARTVLAYALTDSSA